MVKKNSVIFLDRDGVVVKSLIRNKKGHAPISLRQFKILSDAKKSCDLLKNFGFKIIIITNQPDVGNGKIKKKDINKMHSDLKKEIRYDDLYMSISHSSKSYYRKPNPGLLKLAEKKHNVDFSSSFFIGDRKSDIECASKVRCKSIFIDLNYNECKPKKQVKTVKNLEEATKFILKYVKNKKN